MRRSWSRRAAPAIINSVTPQQAAINAINALISPRLFYLGGNGVEDTGNATAGVQYSRLTDLSGFGNHADQSTQGRQCTANTVGSDAGFSFAGAASYPVPFAWANGSTGMTLFLAARFNATNINQDVFALDSTDLILRGTNAAGWRLMTGASDYYNVANGYDTNTHLYAAVYQPGQATKILLERDGANQTTAPAGTIASSLAITLSGYLGANNAANFSNATIFAFIAAPSIVSPTDRATVRTHLKTLITGLP